MILLKLKPLAAWHSRKYLISALAVLLLFAHGCHGDDEDHELSVPLPLRSQSQE